MHPSKSTVITGQKWQNLGSLSLFPQLREKRGSAGKKRTPLPSGVEGCTRGSKGALTFPTRGQG